VGGVGVTYGWTDLIIGRASVNNSLTGTGGWNRRIEMVVKEGGGASGGVKSGIGWTLDCTDLNYR